MFRQLAAGIVAKVETAASAEDEQESEDNAASCQFNNHERPIGGMSQPSFLRSFRPNYAPLVEMTPASAWGRSSAR